MPLNAEEVKAAASRRRHEDVHVEEMGGEVRIQSLTAGTLVRLEFETNKAEREGRDREEYAFRYIAESWVSEKGEPLFPVSEGETIAKSLGKESYKKLARAVLRLNGMTAEAIEDAEKN